MTGRVTTFYSYKGGSGRSMAMANVAWALATNGEKVLTIDWDLEAPGLHRYFHPFLVDPEQSESRGLIDRLWEYIDGLGTSETVSGDERFALADCADVVQALSLPGKSKGCLHFIGAGRQDEAYSDKVGGLDWATFYARFDGQTFIERFVAWARSRYTHILIDSRTGVADTAGICTTQIPDALVMCMVYNRQSIDGTAAIADSVMRNRQARDLPPLDLRIVPCRVEERGEVEGARRHAALRLSSAMAAERPEVERRLRRTEIRHYAWCAFEEKLAVFEDAPDGRGSLLDAMHELSRHVAGGRRLTIANYPPEVLADIWRRAAFDDPRIAELALLDAASTTEALPRLMHWVNEAIHVPDQRADWLMALAETAIGQAGAIDGRVVSHGMDDIGARALSLGAQAMAMDPQYRIRYALLLQTRASQLQKAGDLVDALNITQHAISLFARDDEPVNRWRRARAVERRAELLDAMGERQAAISSYREAIELHQSMSRRLTPLGSDMDLPRVQRVLAEILMETGELGEAEKLAETALRQLQKSSRGRARRDFVEVINILATRASISARLNPARAHHDLMRARAMGHDLLEGEPLRALDQRLRLVEARLAIQQADIPHALALLEHPVEDPAARAAQLGLKAEALRMIGRTDEAADLLIAAVLDIEASINRDMIDGLERVLKTAGRDQEFTDIVFTRMMKAGRDEMALLLPHLQSMGSGTRGSGTPSGVSRARRSGSASLKGSRPRRTGKGD